MTVAAAAATTIVILPVLQDNYVHKSASNVRKIQVEALAHYQPSVSIPVYVRGQFRERLSKETRMYP